MNTKTDMLDIARRMNESFSNVATSSANHVHEKYIPTLLMLESVYRREIDNIKAPTTLHIAIEAAIALLPDRKIGGELDQQAREAGL